MSTDSSDKRNVGDTNPYLDSIVQGSEMGIRASRKDLRNSDLKTVEKACRDFRVALEGKEGGVIKRIEKELKKIEADVKSVMTLNSPDAEILRLTHGQLVDRLKEIQAEYNRLFQSSKEIDLGLQRTVSSETRGDILTRIGESEAIVTVKHKNGKTYRVEQSTDDPESVVLSPRDTNSSAFSMNKTSLLDKNRIPSFFIDEKKVSQVGELGGVALFDQGDVEQTPEIDEREYYHVDTSAVPAKSIRTGGERGTGEVTKRGRRVVDILPKTKITTRPPQTPPRPPQEDGHKVTRKARAPYEIGRTDHDLALDNGILEALRVLGKDAKGLKYAIKSSGGGEVKNVTITRVSEDGVFVRFEHEQGKQGGKVIKIGEQKWNDSMPVLVTDSDSHEQKKHVNVSDAVASTRYDTDGKSTQLESPAVATEVARENGEKFSDAVWGDVKRDKKDLNRIWQKFVSKFAPAEDVPEGFTKMHTDLETEFTDLLAAVEGRQADEQKKTGRGEQGGYVEGKKYNLLKTEGDQYDTLTKRYNQFVRELEDFETSVEKNSDEPLKNSESDGTVAYSYIADSPEHVQALQRGDFDAFFTEQDPTGSEQIGKRYDILVSPKDPRERVEVQIVGFSQKEGEVGVVYVGVDGEGNKKGPQKTLSPEEWEARSPVLATMDDGDFSHPHFTPSPVHEASSYVQAVPALKEPVRRPTVKDLAVEGLVAEHLRRPETVGEQPPKDEKQPVENVEIETAPTSGQFMTADNLPRGGDDPHNGAPTWPGDGPLSVDGLVNTGNEKEVYAPTINPDGSPKEHRDIHGDDAPVGDVEGWPEFDPEHKKSLDELADVANELINECNLLYNQINRLSRSDSVEYINKTGELVEDYEKIPESRERSVFLRKEFIPRLIAFRDRWIGLKDAWDKKRSSVLSLLRNPANWETTRWNKKFWKKKQIRGYIKNPTELLLDNPSLGFENVTEVNDYIRFLEDDNVVYGEWDKKKQRFVSIRLRDYGDSDESDAVVDGSSTENSLDQQGDTANDTDLLKKLTDVETDEHGIDTISAVFAEHRMERLVLSMIQDGDQGFATALADMKTWFSGDSVSPATERWMASLETKQGINRESFSQRWEQSIAERVLGSLRYMVMSKIEQGVLMDGEYQDALDGKRTLPKDSFKAVALRSGYSAIPAVITGVLATALSGGVVAVVGASAAFVGSFSYGALQLRDTKKNVDVQKYQANLGAARERATERATRDVQTQLGDRDNIPLLSQMFRSALIAESATDTDSRMGIGALQELSRGSKIKRSWMDIVRGESPDSTEANMATTDYVLSALALRNAQQSEQSGFALAGATRSKGYMKKLVDVFSAGKVADVTGQTSTAQEYARITANAVIAGMQGAIIASHGTAEWWAKATLRFVTSGVVEGVRTGLEQKKIKTNMAEREFRAEVTAELKEYENALAQIGKGEFALREKKEEILMSVLPVLRYAGDGFETLVQESPDIAARVGAVKTKVLHLQTELHNEYEQFGGRDSAVDFDERVRSTQQKNVYWYGTTVVGRLERRNLDEDDYARVVERGLVAGFGSAIVGGALDFVRSTEIYQQALSALGIGHAPHGSSIASPQHETSSPVSAPEHTAGVERPSSPQEVVPRASAGAMPEHAEAREVADAIPPPANRPGRVAEVLPPTNNAPAQQSRAPIVERAEPSSARPISPRALQPAEDPSSIRPAEAPPTVRPVTETPPTARPAVLPKADAPHPQIPEQTRVVGQPKVRSVVVPEKRGSFLGSARALEKTLTSEEFAKIKEAHPEWGTKKVDILKQWRIEQARLQGQWFDSKAQHFTTRIHPGAEVTLVPDVDGYPRIVLGNDHVQRLDHELVKARGAQTTPPEQGAKEFPVREGGADGKISPAERSVLDARAVQRNADTTLTVGEKSGSVTIPDVPPSKASPSVDVLPGAGGTKASADTTLTVGEKSGATAERVTASASAASDKQNAERVSHIVDRLTTDKHILADARTRAVTMKRGSVPLETFANDYVQARPEFDPKDPKDMFDFYQAWRQKSVEYITGGRGNGGGSIPDASRTSQKSLEPVVPKSETPPPTPSSASGERELPDVRVNKDIPIVLHQGLGDDMRQHVSVWDAGENKAVDIGIKQELRPQVRGGHLVLEISGQRTEGELIQHMVDGKKQWALKVSLPQLGRNEYYNLDNLNKGNVEPTVENR